jgi:hypothetical protein
MASLQGVDDDALMSPVLEYRRSRKDGRAS